MEKSIRQDVGYVRVSTLLQNEARQLEGIEMDKISGRDKNRPELQNCMDHLRSGDVLYVHSVDRLARNLNDLERIVKELTGKGIVIKFEKEGLTFTGDDNPMAKMMLQMMGAFAEMELAMIKVRQREGIAIAKKEGRQIGRARQN